MRLVFAVVELTTVLTQLTRPFVALRLEDEPRLEKDSARVGIDSLEPATQLLVLASIFDEFVDGADDNVEGLAVGKSFEERTELMCSLFQCRVLQSA